MRSSALLHSRYEIMGCTQSKAKAVVVTPPPPPASVSTAGIAPLLSCLESAPSNVIMEANNDGAEEVFIYTTGAVVPFDVVRVRIDSTVVSIPAEAFLRRRKLKEVTFHDSLREIGDGAFCDCIALTKIATPPSLTVVRRRAFEYCYALIEVKLNEGLLDIGKRSFQSCGLEQILIPTTTRRIGEQAFNLANLTILRGANGVERIEDWAFYSCKFAKFRSPPLVTKIPSFIFGRSGRMFSVELPDNVIQIKSYAFEGCHSLRNVALSTHADVEEYAFDTCACLLQVFGTQGALVNVLKSRFEGLPIHRTIYYQSYHPMTLEEIRNAIITDDCGEPNPTGRQQDCLGMTPLHIMACSTVHHLEIFQLMIDTYPENLITEDAWGALPLRYALWGKAPCEIIQLILRSYRIYYRDRAPIVMALGRITIDETLGEAYASLALIQVLISAPPDCFPFGDDQMIYNVLPFLLSP